MENIIDVLRSMPDYIGSNGRSKEEIELAEKMLGVTFAKDYRKYLEEIGLACFCGHELTGLTKTERLHVVSVTKEQRELFGKSDQRFKIKMPTVVCSDNDIFCNNAIQKIAEVLI